ncbi:MAG: endonuclease III [Nitrospinae bacterium]|nr:endonuclease III [Nitrospinota bacterium]
MKKSGEFPVGRAVTALRREVAKFKVPVVGHFADSPFKVLVSTILSLRTKDKTTHEASDRLFAEAVTPEGILGIPIPRLEKLIFPVGFYKVKAATLHHVCKTLIEKHGGNVPRTLDELLAIKGIGRKTANLVVTVGFGLPGICVDVHVHRISNRWGYVKTATPEQTEMALRKKLPPKYWIEYNDLLVAFGQNVCLPLSPFCSRCVLQTICPRIGVPRHR